MRNWILLWATVMGPLLLQGQGTVSLLENSPFLPPAKAAGGNGNNDGMGDSPLALLQFRGITSIEGEYIFSIFDPSTRQSKWLPHGVQVEGLTISDFDLDNNTVVLHSQSDNQSRQLDLNVSATPTSVPGGAPTPNRTTNVPRNTSSTAAAQANRTIDSSRPSRRNVEILRQRREALADQLRQRTNSGATPSNSSQRGGTNRPSNSSRR